MIFPWHLMLHPKWIVVIFWAGSAILILEYAYGFYIYMTKMLVVYKP